MSNKRKNKTADEQFREIGEQAKTIDEVSGRNKSEESDIEQTRIEYRRDADLDDKTPAGDSGPEDASGNETNLEGASDY